MNALCLVDGHDFAPGDVRCRACGDHRADCDCAACTPEDATPARTLRIEVTDEDVHAALAATDFDFAAPTIAFSRDARVMLTSFAERLLARQWEKVEPGTIIPKGMPYRVERFGNPREAEETVTRTSFAVGDSLSATFIPADRADELRKEGARADRVAAHLRAGMSVADALTAEGIR